MSSTLISVTDTPPTGSPNFSPQISNVAVGANVTLKSTGTGTLHVYTWIGVPSATNLPQAIFTTGTMPYSAPKSEGAMYALKATIPANAVTTMSLYQSGSPPSGAAAYSGSGGGMNGTLNVKPG